MSPTMLPSAWAREVDVRYSGVVTMAAVDTVRGGVVDGGGPLGLRFRVKGLAFRV